MGPGRWGVDVSPHLSDLHVYAPAATRGVFDARLLLAEKNKPGANSSGLALAHSDGRLVWAWPLRRLGNLLRGHRLGRLAHLVDGDQGAPGPGPAVLAVAHFAPE